MRKLRRVCITGIGIVSPLGCGTEHVWKRIIAGHCGISALPDGYMPPNVPVHVAAFVPKDSSNPHAYNENAVFSRSVGKEMALFTQYAIYASDLALAHANLNPKSLPSTQLERMGTTVSSGGISSLGEILSASQNFNQSFKKLSPYFVPKILINTAAGQVSLRHGLKGPQHTVATACAAGSHAIGDAFNFIRLGYADCMLAGGAEASIDPLALAGFARMRAVTTSQDPLTASRPFDKKRSGFVMAEGACILVLEEVEVALRRGANVLAEVVGYGLSSDSHHPTSPAPDGDGASRSMRMALWDAGISSHDALNEVGYINAHATSTTVGDEIEASTITALFAPRTALTPLYISSTKGATGHLLGAAGALETGLTALALRDGMVPPTINLDCPHPLGGPLAHVPHTGIVLSNVERRQFRFALKNSFGFGGTNASLVLKRWEG